MDYSKIKGATFVRFKKNECFVHAGDQPEYFYVVASGYCHRIRLEENGNNTIRTVYSKGSIVCALMAYRNVVPKSDIVADTTLCCWKIPRQNFIDELDRNPEVAKHLMDQIIDEYLDLSSQFFGRKNGETPKLLCKFLFSHAQMHDDGFLYMNKSYNNVKIAAHLGVHKVTATRIINALQKEQTLTRTKDGLQITNPEQLQYYAAGKKTIKYK